jgi:putative endonuclease
MKRTEQRRKAYRLGHVAEHMAAAYLFCKGYRILGLRHRNALGEIDLLAVKGDTLVAVEVKARKTFSACEESIPPMKQQRIARAMEGVLAGNKIAGLAAPHPPNIRFDAVWIVPYRLPRHIKDAWRL